ncbi:hypothetical protein TRP66_04105 [Pseudomonas sp. JDS28PS106]|uniref:hypothetical protein n=1 Tax=Pseudomonas sp. JDS28PS106 TaxID=2497235 RepID=UPI002FD2AFAE
MDMYRFRVSTHPQAVEGPETFVRRLHDSNSINAVLLLAVECDDFIRESLSTACMTRADADALHRLFDQEVNARLGCLRDLHWLSGNCVSLSHDL